MSHTHLQPNFAEAVIRYRLIAVTFATLNALFYLLILRSFLSRLENHQAGLKMGLVEQTLIENLQDAIRQGVQVIGPVATKVLFLICVYSVAALIPLLIQLLVVRLACRNPLLRCTGCSRHIADKNSIKAIRSTGLCPSCGRELIPHDEVGENPFLQERLPFC